jgi:hypothetical protein
VITNGTVFWIGGLALVALTIVVHSITLVYVALFLNATRNKGFYSNLSPNSMVWFAILVVAAAGAILALLHATEMAIWAISYLIIGAMTTWTDALLYSIDSMTTRGASSLQLAEEWRLMGALEAADGMLLFGISTAFLFAVLQQIAPMLSAGGSKNGRR